MPRPALGMQKVTISLRPELVRYADDRAARFGMSRSEVVGHALTTLQEREEEELAREGYAWYAAEAEEFAAASLRAVTEALNHAR